MQLDVYHPSGSLNHSKESNETGTPPILVFLYGGGLIQGARSSPCNLVHNNLGAFFASQGILTIIPDYRLVPGITYPQGSEDVRDALAWTTANLASESDNTSQIHILAHSAGGMHLNGFLLNPALFPPFAHAIRGVALMGSPCNITPDMQKLYPVAREYYGSAKMIAKEEPLSLLRRVSGEYVAKLPPLRMLVAGSEPRRISNSMRAFGEAFKEKGGVVDELVLEGHDHLSPVLALSSGTGEEWGYEIVRWVYRGRGSRSGKEVVG